MNFAITIVMASLLLLMLFICQIYAGIDKDWQKKGGPANESSSGADRHSKDGRKKTHTTPAVYNIDKKDFREVVQRLTSKKSDNNSQAASANSISNAPILNTPILNTPILNTPISNAPISNAPILNTPISNAPILNTPILNTPISNAPISNAPILNTPISNTPISNAPISNAPILNTPISNAPILNTPISNAPILNTPILNTPISNAPILNTPISNAPILNTPILNTPISNAPILNTPISNAPILNTPISNAPILNTLASNAPTYVMPSSALITQQMPMANLDYVNQQHLQAAAELLANNSNWTIEQFEPIYDYHNIDIPEPIQDTYQGLYGQNLALPAYDHSLLGHSNQWLYPADQQLNEPNFTADFSSVQNLESVFGFCQTELNQLNSQYQTFGYLYQKQFDLDQSINFPFFDQNLVADQQQQNVLPNHLIDSDIDQQQNTILWTENGHLFGQQGQAARAQLFAENSNELLANFGKGGPSLMPSFSNFGSDGPSSMPSFSNFGSDGPSSMPSFSNFGSDGPSSMPSFSNFGSDGPSLMPSFPSMSSDYHPINEFGQVLANQNSNAFLHGNSAVSSNVLMASVEKQKTTVEEKQKMKRPIIAAVNESEAEKRSKNVQNAEGPSSSDADLANQSLMMQNERGIINEVLRAIGVALSVVGTDPPSIKGILDQIVNGSLTGNEKFFVETSRKAKKMKPKALMEQMKKGLIGDEQQPIETNKIYKEMIGQMIGQIDREIETTFGQNIFKEGNIQRNDLLELRFMAFFRHFFRKLIGLLEAPFNLEDLGKFEEMTKKSKRAALIVWLIEARKHIFMKFMTRVRTSQIANRDGIISSITNLDTIENWKEQMNLVFFAVEMTVTPLIGQHILNRSELLGQIAGQNIVCMIRTANFLDFKQIIILANSMASRISYARKFKKIFAASIDELVAQHKGQKEPKVIINAKIYAHFYAVLLNIAQSHVKEMHSPHAPRYDEQSWQEMMQFLAKSVGELNNSINMYSNRADPSMQQKRN